MSAAATGLIGRDDELETVRSLLTSPGSLPRVLVLEGEAGIGKTTLLGAGVADARSRGFAVLECSATGAETQLSFAALRDLVDGVFDAIADDLPPPRRRALAITLLREEPAGRPPDPGAIGVSLLTALRLLAARGPLLLAVDDVQWLDPGSAAPLSYVLRRLRDEPIAVLLSLRAEAGEGWPPLLEHVPPEHLAEIRLGPVSLGSLGRILRERLDVTFPRPTLQRLHAAAGGNPFFALESARAVGRGGAPLRIGAPLPVPATLRVLVRERLVALPADTQEGLLVASALARADLGLVGAALARDATPVLDAAVDANIAAIDGDAVRFVHPLFAAAVYGRAPAAARRDVHRRLAEVVPDREERARHLALATEAPDKRVAQSVEDAAAAAYARGSPAAAAELIGQARRLTPARSVQDARRRARSAVDYEFAAGDTARSATLLEEMLAEAPAGPQRAQLLSRQARVRHFADDIGASVELLHAALAEAGDEAALRAEIEESLAWSLLLMRRDVPAAAEHASSAARWAERAGDSAALAQALAAEALTSFALGAEWEETMHRALSLEAATQDLRVLGQPAFAYGYCLSCADDLDRARAVFEALRRRAAEQGDESAMPSLLNHLALVECLAGRLDLSASLADESYVLALEGGHVPTQASALAKRAMVAARQGETDAARATADRALALAGDDALARGGETAIWTLGFVELSVGDPGAADRRLRPLVDAILASGIQEPGEIRCLPDEIEALIQLARIEEAEALLITLEGWAQRLRRPSALGAAERCRGLLLDGPAALLALERAAGRGGPPFEHARTLLALGAAQRRARRRSAARQTLEAARASFDALGAAQWAAKARDELGRIGGRPPSSGELTPAERRVADLVAEGRTNQEVATALVVSVHTVESALTQAYRKLGVRSRTELARRFAERA